jgi:hypothetical protein
MTATPSNPVQSCQPKSTRQMQRDLCGAITGICVFVLVYIIWRLA